jgi:hypothetical protein
MSEQRQYPVSMHHPNFRAATTAVTNAAIGDRGYKPPQPITLGPVIVHNERDEQFYIARGYIPEGGAAFNRLNVPTMPIPRESPDAEAKPAAYPKWVGDDPRVMVKSEAEELAYYDTHGYPPEAVLDLPASLDIAPSSTLTVQSTSHAADEFIPALTTGEWKEFQAWKAAQSKPRRRSGWSEERRASHGAKLRATQELKRQLQERKRNASTENVDANEG